MFVKQDVRVERLATVDLFRGCSKAELRTLARITNELAAPAGTVVCEEGRTGSDFFVVVSGEAAVTIDGQRVDTIGPGGFFGEMALLDGGPRVATVTADDDMVLLVLSRQEFMTLLGELPGVARKMLAALGARLRLAHEQRDAGQLGV